jgi:hypothetical protein
MSSDFETFMRDIRPYGSGTLLVAVCALEHRHATGCRYKTAYSHASISIGRAWADLKSGESVYCTDEPNPLHTTSIWFTALWVAFKRYERDRGTAR